MRRNPSDEEKSKGRKEIQLMRRNVIDDEEKFIRF